MLAAQEYEEHFATVEGKVHTQGTPSGDYFAVINKNGDFEVGCKTIYPAIWNQYALPLLLKAYI